MTKESILSASNTTRVLFAGTSLGGLAKSLLAEVLTAFADISGVTCRVTDADPEHRTLSKRISGSQIASLNEPGDFLKLIKKIGKTYQVEVIDLPAQKNDYVLSAFNQFNILDLAAQDGVRFTVLLFVADAPAAEESLTKTIQAFTNQVDYLVIKNPARYKSTHYEGGAVQKTLNALGAMEIDVPLITQTTLDEMQRAKVKAGKWLPLTEVARSPDINKYSQHEIEFFLNRMFMQFQAARHLIFPSGIKGSWQPYVAEKPAKMELNLDINL